MAWHGGRIESRATHHGPALLTRGALRPRRLGPARVGDAARARNFAAGRLLSSAAPVHQKPVSVGNASIRIGPIRPGARRDVAYSFTSGGFVHEDTECGTSPANWSNAKAEPPVHVGTGHRTTVGVQADAWRGSAARRIGFLMRPKGFSRESARPLVKRQAKGHVGPGDRPHDGPITAPAMSTRCQARPVGRTRRQKNRRSNIWLDVQPR